MKFGFVKVAAGTHKISVADVKSNVIGIKDIIEKACQGGASLLVTSELGLTGYTCGDLFYQDKLLNDAIDGVFEIAKFTAKKNILVFVGLPLRLNGRIFNVAAVLFDGKILAFIPKTYLPNYAEFYEKRQFCPASEQIEAICVKGEVYPFGKNILLRSKNMLDFCVACEICEDMWVANSPSISHALNGATVIANLSASNETVGKAEYRRQLVSSTSAKLCCGYVYCDAGEGESTTDIVFSGHNLIAENGKILGETKLFENGIVFSEIDVSFLNYERSKIFNQPLEKNDYKTIYFNMELTDTALTRSYPILPFVPDDKDKLSDRAELILTIQAEGLKRRIEHTGAKTAVIGISGGLDSSLALLVAVRAMKKLNRPLHDVLCITMPCFGTTDRTYNNAIKLVKALSADLKEINISTAVKQHFKDISQEENRYDVTFENAQARERTQVLMDIANQTNGLVVGTGDLSELALGWATYNGDHMSMYGVNASIPKTLVRHLVAYEAKKNIEVTEVLNDILSTPVSPELLPAKDNKISQRTEEIVGPYELHDFFLYYMLRCGYSAEKLSAVAKYAFDGIYADEIIEKWLKTFIRRFFTQQYKRSCIPDGVKVGSVALSPRGDWRMPSDVKPLPFLC